MDPTASTRIPLCLHRCDIRPRGGIQFFIFYFLFLIRRPHDPDYVRVDATSIREPHVSARMGFYLLWIKLRLRGNCGWTIDADVRMKWTSGWYFLP
jgi:hypothetical protein